MGTSTSKTARSTSHQSASARQSMRTFLGDSSEGEWHPELHGNGLTPFDPMQRHEMISQAAYFIAERRDFADGGADDDWLKAELEIDRMLAQLGNGPV
jgi:hypothetical protein